MGTGFWTLLWKKPRLAYGLGGVALMLGIALGWAGLGADNLKSNHVLLLSASFLFALWSLLTCVGSMATYAQIVAEVLKTHAESLQKSPRGEDSD